MPIAVINPATGETEEKFAALSPAALDERLTRAAAAAASYRRTTFDARAGWMRAAADGLDRDRDEVATMMTTEMGKTLAAARAEVEKCARACRFYADHAAAARVSRSSSAAGESAANFSSVSPVAGLITAMGMASPSRAGHAPAGSGYSKW